MKQLTATFRRVIPSLTLLISVLLAPSARAVGMLMFDPNGTLPGTGIINGGTYSWDGRNWLSGTTLSYWVPGSIAGFSGGANSDIYTITVTNHELITGLYDTASDLNLTISGTGDGSLELASGLQAFWCAGTMKITAPITGAGGLAPELGGWLYLYGPNTYSGGTQLGINGNSGAFFNNNHSFGVGPITLGANTLLVNSDATAPLTLTNSVSAVAGTLRYFGPAAAPVTWSGPWALGAGTLALSVGTASYPTSQMTISGPICGTGASLVKASSGTLLLAGANTYDGATTVQAGTLELAGSIAGSVTNTGGVLQLDSASALSADAVVALASSLPAGAVKLQFAGTQRIRALTIDGVSQAPGTWGAPDSGAQYTSTLLSGTGQFRVVGPPQITQQPQSGSAYPDGTYTFSVGVLSDSAFTYQWKFNGNNIPGASDSSYTVSLVEAPNAGRYSCWLTNSYGWTNTVEATLTVLATNWYVNTIRADHPIAYWRLDETNGTLAHDWVGGNIGLYTNVVLNQPGFNLRDPNPGIKLPANPAARGAVQVTNYALFAFPGTTPFTLEAWACFTNLNGSQRLFSTMSLTSPGGWAFGIDGSDRLVFVICGLHDVWQSLSTPLVTRTWYHLACTCDGAKYHFYVNGWEVGSGVPIPEGGIVGVHAALTLGCNPLNSPQGAGFPVAEQMLGSLDEVAIYDHALSASQIIAHVFTLEPRPRPDLTWPTPAAIPYGTALSTNQLNATASVEGTFTYDPPAGTVLNAGTHFLFAYFAPTDTVDYNRTEAYVILPVLPAPLQVAAQDASRLYGQPNPVFTGTLTGVTNGDNITVSWSSSATPSSPPGTYSIVPSLVDPDGRLTNYTVFTQNGTLTISGPPAISGLSYSVSGTNSITGARTVVLSALVNPGGVDSVAWFQYGLDTTYAGSSTAVALPASTVASPVSATWDGVVPGAIYHCRVGASNSLGMTYSADQLVSVPALYVPGDLNGDGMVDQGELNAALTNYFAHSPWLLLTNTVGLGSTQVQFALTNTSDWSFSVLMSTNLADWEYLGAANALFQFTDPGATNSPTRFYRLRWP